VDKIIRVGINGIKIRMILYTFNEEMDKKVLNIGS
jgi:hypothetical protein